MTANKPGKLRFKYTTAKNIKGFLFVLPWLIGFVVFFAIPIFNTILYSFNKVEVGEAGGIVQTWNGIKNFIDLFQKEVTTLSQPIQRMFVDENSRIFIRLPLIVVFSLFLAMIANARFPGRGVVRVIFFMPIILGLQLLTDWAAESTGRQLIESASKGIFDDYVGAELLFEYTFLPRRVILFLADVISDISTLISQTGVQTLIFLAGLQSISPSHYEVAKIEGANGYTVFWKVTLPMLANVAIFTIVYTLIDLFKGSAIAEEVYAFAFRKSAIGVGSALSVVYMLNAMLALGLVYLFMRAVKIVDKQ